MKNFKRFCWSLSILFLVSCATSKTYAPSQTNTTPRNGFLENEKIDVVFFDSRSEKQKSKEVQNSILSNLNKTYPSASFQKLYNSEYFSSPSDDKITIKINLVGYNVSFPIFRTTQK